MSTKHQNIVSLLEFVKMDSFYVVCHFKCKVTNRKEVAAVEFEPYDGRIEIRFKDMLLHPIDSWNRYYHTPITIYGNDTHETIVLKAFKKVSDSFRWNDRENRYVHI
ncbi:MAG: hypothetical protein U9Q40_11445 [Campylobacterota bacterium]|nr:hypothetical protein [Campylobacterota bacterium]